MPANKEPSAPVPPPNPRALRLRIIGIIVLVAGIAGAGVLYWMRTRSPDLSNDLSLQGFNRAEQRQMAQLYGQSGLMVDEWVDDLKQPGTQAVLIAGFSVLVFAGCFYFARLLDYDDEPG